MAGIGLPCGTRRSTGLPRAFEPRDREVYTTRGTFGMFSCSKTTNELNYVAQKFVRSVIGSKHDR